MLMPMQLLSDLSINKNTKFFFIENNTFPVDPYNGQMAFVSGILYIYANLRGISTWYPLTNSKKCYVHVQGSASIEWIVSHSMESTDFIMCVYNSNNEIIFANISDVISNSFKLNFTEAVTGKCVVFFDDTFNNTTTFQNAFEYIKSVDGTNSGLDADLLDGNQGTHYLNYENLTNIPLTFPPSLHNHNITEVNNHFGRLYTNTNVYGNVSLDVSSYERFNLTLTDDITNLTFVNVPSPPACFNIRLKQVSGNKKILAYDSKFKFINNTPPVLGTNIGDIDYLMIEIAEVDRWEVFQSSGQFKS